MSAPHLPATIPPGRPVQSGADGTYMIVHQGYSSGRRHQWGSELARNGLQALLRRLAAGLTARGDEQIVFDFLNIGFVDGNGAPILDEAWKRRIWNTADPMTPAELIDYFSTLSKGAGGNRFHINNLAGQYGQGSRFSVLPHSGMFVATTQPGGGTEAVYIYDTGHDTYSLANFIFPARGTDEDLADMSEDCYLDLGNDRYLKMDEATLIHPDVIAAGGVTTILMGPDIFDHYVEGDPARGETSRGLADDLTKWLNFPIDVEVWEMRPKSKGGNRAAHKVVMDGQVKYKDAHILKNYKDWFDRVPVGNQATVQVFNPDLTTTDIDVYLLPEDWNWEPVPATEAKKLGSRAVERNGNWYRIIADKDMWFPWRGMGFVVYGYDYEMIPTYDTGTRQQQLKNWGVNLSSVADRTALVIRPPKLAAVAAGATWGVQQTGSRGTILGPNGSALPIDDWTNEFFELLSTSPDLDFLRKALEEAKPAKARGIDPADLKRIQQTIKGRLALTPQDILVTTTVNTGVPATAGTQTATKSGSGGGGGGGGGGSSKTSTSTTAVPAPTGSLFTTTRKTDAAPDYDFLTMQEWTDKEKIDSLYAPENFCVVEVGGAGTSLYFNSGHPIYVGQRTYYTSPTGYFKEIGNLNKLRKTALSDIEEAIEEAFGTLGITTVFYAYEMSKRNGRSDVVKFKTLVEPEAMTLALGGGNIPFVDRSIKERIGKL